MATVPDVTELTPLTFDAEGIMNAVWGHITGSSTKFSASTATTPYNGTAPEAGEGFVVTPVSGLEAWQLNFRRTAAENIEISIEPDESITEPGSPTGSATGTGADWSDEGSFVTTAYASGGKVWIVEVADALFVMISDSTNTFYSQGLHAGRVYIPWDGDDTTNGRDGLGFLVGVPDEYNAGTSTDWTGSSTDSKYHYWTNQWDRPGTTAVIPTVNQNGTIVKPLPFYTYIDNATSQRDSHVGYSKYIRYWHTTLSPKARLESDQSNQAWAAIHDANILGKTLIIWKVGVVP